MYSIEIISFYHGVNDSSIDITMEHVKTWKKLWNVLSPLLSKNVDSGIRELAAELNVTLSDSDVETVKTRCSMEAMKKKAGVMRNAGKIDPNVKVYRKG